MSHVLLSECLCVGHNGKPYKSGRTNPDAVLAADSRACGLWVQVLCIKWGSYSLAMMGNFIWFHSFGIKSR